MKTDDLERRLEEMFASEAAQLDVPGREWSDAIEVRGPDLLHRPRRRLVTMGAVAAVLAATGAGALALESTDEQRVATDGAAATGSTSAPPVFRVETKQVELTAASMVIEIDDGGVRRTFSGRDPEASSDPGTMNEYTTLELTWAEHDVEMRMNIYFTSDGIDWWSNEVRTYDGRAQGEWITYQGEFFRSRLGSPFVGNLDIGASDHGVTGRLRLSDMTIEAFRRPEACRSPKAPLALDAGVDRAVVGIGPNHSYGVRVQLLETAACRAVPADDLSYVWTVEHAAIAAVQPSGARADIKGLALGSTPVHVRATRAGRVVGDATFVVEVTSRANLAAAVEDPPAGTPPTP